MAKRRADGNGSITWDASVQLWVGRLPRDDRGRRAKVSAKTKAEARAKLQQRLRERELRLSTDAGRTTSSSSSRRGSVRSLSQATSRA